MKRHNPLREAKRVVAWRVLPVLLVAAIGIRWSDAEAQATQWIANYNGPGNNQDSAAAIAVDAAGDVVVTGSSWGTRDEDYATVKYDGISGTQLWVARYSGPWGNDAARAVAIDAARNVFVTGYSRGDWGSDYATIKYDGATGNQLWAARYAGPGNGDDMAMALAVDAMGNVIVTGASWDPASQHDYVTIKYDGATGNQVWLARYNAPANAWDRSHAVAVDSAGNVIVSGWSRGVDSDYDYATIKYDGATGAQIWAARYNGSGNGEDMPWALALDGTGNAYVTGWSRGVGGDDEYDYATIKYDGATGNQVWEARYNSGGGDNSVDKAWALAVDAAGNVIVTGNSFRRLGSDSITDPDAVTIKYRGSNGDVIWTHRYEGPDNAWDGGVAVGVNAAGDAFVTGASWSPETEEDYATLKLSAATGGQEWVVRHTTPRVDWPSALAVNADGCVYVTGISSADYGTIKYCEAFERPRFPRFPRAKDPWRFLPFCIDIPGRWPNPGGLPIAFAGPSCPPPPSCPRCSFAAGWDPGRTPPYLSGIYAEVLGSLSPTAEVQLTQRAIQQLAGLLRKAPSGRHFTDTLKASVIDQLEKARTAKVPNPQVTAVVIRSISALELDWRVPKLVPAEVKAGKYSALDFQGVAWIGMREIAKPGRVTLRMEAGLPAPAAGFSASWPLATYAFDFTGEPAKDGYMDVSVHTGGIRFEGAPSQLRMLEWDGKAYRDITTHVDASRGIITGRTTRLTRYVLMTR